MDLKSIDLTAYEIYHPETDTFTNTPESPRPTKRNIPRLRTPEYDKRKKMSSAGKKTKRKGKKHKKTKRKVKKPKRKTKRKARGKKSLVNTHYMRSLDREPADIGQPSAEPTNITITDEILSKLSKDNIDILIEKLSEKDKAELLEILDKKLSK
tara:strand:+ start:636 stop:1097 length:462 start_codon:yes stop_codon:yes gene_type:complete